MLDGSLQANNDPVRLDVVPHTQQSTGGQAPAPSGDPVSPQPGVKLETPQQPGEPPATETPNKPEVKPGDGKGRGGKEEKWTWDGKAFNLENIQKFLESPEGRKWLLIDPNGFAGIGRKLTAAADAGVSGANLLTPEERKKIYARLKKERAERKKKEKEKNK
jgi:hypothetical protein